MKSFALSKKRLLLSFILETKGCVSACQEFIMQTGESLDGRSMNQFFKKLEQLLRSMENATLYKVIIGIVLLAFWGYGSGWLTANPSLTGYVISFSYGMLAVVTIVIQLVLRENLQVKMKKVLNAEIEERKEGLLEELKKLLSYLERTKYPNYSESGVEGLEDDFREFDQIKSKYTFQPKIIHSTIFLVLSSLDRKSVV